MPTTGYGQEEAASAPTEEVAETPAATPEAPPVEETLPAANVEQRLADL
jgi:hypothetical protein